MPAWDTVWAEDGSVFLQEAADGSAGSDVLEPYAGYAHVVPRLVARLAAFAPIGAAAAMMAVAATLLVVAVAAMLFGTRASLRAIPVQRRVAALACLSYGVVFLVVPLIVRGSSASLSPTVGMIEQTGESRYLVPPVLLFLTGFLVCIDGWWTSGHRVAAAVAAGWIAVAVVTSLRIPTVRSEGPGRRDEVRRAEATCRDGASSAAIGISPPGWNTVIACHRLDQRGRS